MIDNLFKFALLSNEDKKKIIISIFIMIVGISFIFFLLGNVIGIYETQNKIQNKLVSLSEKENLPLPDNNYFKINNQVYEIRKVNTSINLSLI
jgi:hypothetical protein